MENIHLAWGGKHRRMLSTITDGQRERERERERERGREKPLLHRLNAARKKERGRERKGRAVRTRLGAAAQNIESHGKAVQYVRPGEVFASVYPHGFGSRKRESWCEYLTPRGREEVAYGEG